MAGTGLNLRAAIKSVQILEILAPALSPTFQNFVLRTHTYTLFQKYGMAKFYFFSAIKKCQITQIVSCLVPSYHLRHESRKNIWMQLGPNLGPLVPQAIAQSIMALHYWHISQYLL